MLHLYEVLIQDNETGEKIRLKVNAHNTDEATCSITNGLFGCRGPYRWLGTGPLYKGNKLIDIEE